MIFWMAWAGLVLAAIPAVMVLVNRLVYRRAGSIASIDVPVSVLVPARDEAAGIESCLHALLRSRGVEVEIVVLDDASSDATGSIVERVAASDARVRLVRGSGPPAGWNGKQYACHLLAGEAGHDLLLFVDADVRVEPDGVARMATRMLEPGVDLLSGVPRQLTGTWMEAAVVPLIHFVLLGFLPMPAMRRSRRPAFAAGCGQLMLASREAYLQAGGHAALRSSRHDGLMLPRAFRRAGRTTDLIDATDLASCRMYQGARAVWTGFAKNAGEGMGSAGAILPWTVLLGGGQILPWGLLLPAWLRAPEALLVVVGALALGLGTRGLLALWFRQPLAGVLLHPLGVGLLLAIQWYALALRTSGRQLTWRGRVDPGETA